MGSEAYGSVGRWAADAKQAGDAAADSGQHSLPLLQRPLLELPGTVRTHPQQLPSERGHDETTALRHERGGRRTEVERVSTVKTHTRTIFSFPDWSNAPHPDCSDVVTQVAAQLSGRLRIRPFVSQTGPEPGQTFRRHRQHIHRLQTQD